MTTSLGVTNNTFKEIVRRREYAKLFRLIQQQNWANHAYIFAANSSTPHIHSLRICSDMRCTAYQSVFSRATRRTTQSRRRDVDSRGGWLKMLGIMSTKPTCWPRVRPLARVHDEECLFRATQLGRRGCCDAATWSVRLESHRWAESCG